MNLYEKNLKALSSYNEVLAKKLEQLSSNEIFEVYLAECDELQNANVLDHRDKSVVYHNNPSTEIQLKLREFELYDNYPLLYCYGIGNGSFYKELLSNPKHQSVMVIEPELELIYIALNLVDLSQELKQRRLVINLSSDVDKQYFINEFGDKSKYFLKVYNLHIYSKYYDKFKDEIKRVNKAIIDAYKYTLYVLGNCAGDAIIGLDFALKNIPKMIKTPSLHQLFVKSQNTRNALIVSTGPSLAKQLPLLKKMQDHVTILCIDASFPILAKEGIKPDIVFSIERVDLTAKFYINTPKEAHKDVYFALATVCHDEIIKNVHGQKCFFMRADSHNMYFGLNEWGYLGGGMSAANYAFDFATKSGFDNIIFIGQDLSYGKDGSSHSKNHVFGEDEIKSKDIVEHVEAYGGDGVVPTTEIWRAFLNSFEMQVKYANSNSINSTEGGARIHGTAEMPFNEVCEKVLDRSKKKEQISLELPASELIDKNLKKFYKQEKKAIDIGKSMREHAKDVYNEFEEFLSEIEHYTNNDIEDKIEFERLDKLIDKISEVKGIYNDKKFANMYSTLLLAYVVNHEYDVAKVYVMRDNTDLAKKLKKIAWIRVHQEWLYRVYTNLDVLIALLEESYKSKKD